MENTNLQEIFDSFFAKLPGVNFDGKETLIIQWFKTAIAKCHRKTYDNLEYTYDVKTCTGFFYNHISQDSIELIAMFMVKEYYFLEFSKLAKQKQYIGTQAFNKLFSLKEKYDMAKQSMDSFNSELDRFIMDFPDYSEER